MRDVESLFSKLDETIASGNILVTRAINVLTKNLKFWLYNLQFLTLL